MKYVCPICKWDELDEPPEDHKICHNCGTHFDYDDCWHTHRQLQTMWEAAGKPTWGSDRWGYRWIDWYYDNIGEPPRPDLLDAKNNLRRQYQRMRGVSGVGIEGDHIVVWVMDDDWELREILRKEFHGYEVRIRVMGDVNVS
jgi:hypothetical protein